MNLSMFDTPTNTGAAEQAPLRSTPASSSPSQFHAHTQAPDQSSITLTPGAPSTSHNVHSSPKPISSLQPTNRTAPMQGQPAVVPRFNPSAMGLSACQNLTRPLTMQEKENLLHLDRLKYFLATAPSRWSQTGSINQNNSFPSHPSLHPSLNRFLLPSSEHVTCVSWDNRYYITGTDIVRVLVFRFEAFGRPVRNMKKFEEGIFSDLRNLKPGEHACLEEPKSPFLDHLFKYQCIRTQKKQKVFYWLSVPHDRLFLDALERDLKRENMGLEPTTVVLGEPAQSFTYEPQRSLYEQFSSKDVIETDSDAIANIGVLQMNGTHDTFGSTLAVSRAAAVHNPNSRQLHPHNSRIGFPSALHGQNKACLPYPIFDGSPTYKQRRKRSANRTDATTRSSSEESNYTHHSASDVGVGVGYGPGDSGMTAADMFISQARGEQDIGVRRAKAMLQVCGDMNWSASQFALGRSSVHNAPARFGQLSNREYGSQPDLLSYTEDPLLRTSHCDTNGYPITGKGLTTKVFACPLMCCGRMFKRLEHLKRHMRTHTMERPFQCLRCGRRFSRSDNLNQHHRTHARADGAETPAGELLAFDAEMENEEGDFADLSFAEGGLNDSRKYERELSGHVQDVPDDEEGLVEVPGVSHSMNTDPASDGSLGNAYFSQTMTGDHSVHLESSEIDCQWPFGNSPLMATTSDGEPILAPLTDLPHRQEFSVDNMPFYPYQSVAISSEIGPHRRHRSATPSLIRSHSTSSSDSRNYHPYSRTSSSHSSPAALPHSLDVPSYIISNDAFITTQPRSFSAPSLTQGSLDIGDFNLDSIFSSPVVPYLTEPDSFELSHQYPNSSFEPN